MPQTVHTKTVDQYIAGFAPPVRAVLKKLRAIYRANLPKNVVERISYGIPAYWLEGDIVYFAAFKNHVSVFPPLRSDAKLQKATARYQNEKGNLRFSLDEPIPYELIRKVVQRRWIEHCDRIDSKRDAVRNAKKHGPSVQPQKGAQKPKSAGVKSSHSRTSNPKPRNRPTP